MIKKLLLFFSFVLGNFSILLVAILALTVYTTKDSTAAASQPLENLDIIQVSYDSYAATPDILGTSTAMIVAKDARIVLTDNFFKKYSSPMMGLGKDIVEAADKHKIPFGYLPAIAQCEGNLGKVMPSNSYNTWGWGIYGETMTKFSSWQDAIETVSKGLKEHYFDLGLDTPEEIQTKYTPPSQGSWANCVHTFLAELN